MIPNDAYIDVTLRVPLWERIPPEDRVTEELIRDRYQDRPDWLANRLIERLRNPRCKVATQDGALQWKWLPCAYEATGDGLCYRHGGPRKAHATTELARLREEVARLRAEAAEARA